MAPVNSHHNLWQHLPGVMFQQESLLIGVRCDKGRWIQAHNTQKDVVISILIACAYVVKLVRASSLRISHLERVELGRILEFI